MASFKISPLPMYFLVFVFYTLCFPGVSGELQKFEQALKADGSLSLLVVGDWGRKGLYNQSQVAVQMGRIGKELDINFIISDGDNFYDDGLTGVNDPAFKQSFSNIYTAESLQKRWYNILGNHDYRGNVEAQLDPVLRSIDRRWLCLRSYILETGIADFFFVDTAPFVDKYFTDPEDHTYDWSGVLPRETYLSGLLRDVDSALRNSDATWKIVVGHHPIRSIGEHGDTEELVEKLLPILKVNNVSMYINGHDHCLQHISSNTSSLQYMTSGGSSKAWRNNTGDLNRDGVKFYYDGQGFMSLKLTKTKVEAKFYDVNGIGLYYLNLNK